MSKYTLSAETVNRASSLFTRKEIIIDAFKNNKSPKKNRILAKVESRFSYKISEIQASFNEKAGFACIAEKRAIELKMSGIATTAYMKMGDTVRIEVLNTEGKSMYGAIKQTVSPLVR